MDKSIEYYYKIHPKNIKKYSRYYFFDDEYNSYILAEYQYSEKNLLESFQLYNDLIVSGYKCHHMIINKYNKLLTNIGDKKYVLLKLNSCYKEKVDITDILYYENKYVAKANLTKRSFKNWALLWEKKIDYYEKQMYSFGINKKIIISSFSYYVGMAENAIVYYNNSLSKNIIESKQVLSHNRVYYPNIWLNYGNPLSLTIDIPQRDEAEYIKYTFFYSNIKEAYDEFDFLIRAKKISRDMAQMLLSRLLFPTYYFDLYEKIILNEEAEEKIVAIIKKQKEYEVFLKYCYKKINQFVNINPYPNWLL